MVPWRRRMEPARRAVPAKRCMPARRECRPGDARRPGEACGQASSSFPSCSGPTCDGGMVC